MNSRAGMHPAQEVADGVSNAAVDGVGIPVDDGVDNPVDDGVSNAAANGVGIPAVAGVATRVDSAAANAAVNPATTRPAWLLARAACEYPERLSLVDPRGEFTVAQSWQYSAALASWLREQGIHAGQRVAIVAPNSGYHLLLWLACDIIGAVFVPVGERLADVEVARILSDCAPRIVVADGRHAAAIGEYATISVAALHHVLSLRIAAWGAQPVGMSATAGDTAVVFGAGIAEAATSGNSASGSASDSASGSASDTIAARRIAEDAGTVPVAPTWWSAASVVADLTVAGLTRVHVDDPAAIIYTSGSSGRPRGAIHTRQTMWWAWQCYRDQFDYGNLDVEIVLAPLSHIGGFNGTTNDLFCHGGTVVVVPHFQPQQVAALIHKYQATIGFAVPTMMIALLDNADPHLLASWRRPLIGGSPLPASVAARMRECGLRPIHVWGMTETGGAGACLAGELALTHPESCGWPFTHSRVRIVEFAGVDAASGTASDSAARGDAVAGVDAAAATITAAGQVGMITIGGPHIVQRYWPDIPTAQDPDTGYLITGDLGEWTEDGRLVIRGRAGDVINTGAEKVHPAEVEEVLAGLVGSGHLVIVGEPDPYWGERVVAVTDSAISEDQIRSYGRERLAGYKLPKKIVRVAQIPLNATGKIDRQACARLFKDARSAR